MLIHQMMSNGSCHLGLTCTSKSLTPLYLLCLSIIPIFSSQLTANPRPPLTAPSSPRLPLVLPTDSKYQLAVNQQGMDLLRSIKGPVAPLVVIGPYRSGKSFLLNQLLGVPCGEESKNQSPWTHSDDCLSGISDCVFLSRTTAKGLVEILRVPE